MFAFPSPLQRPASYVVQRPASSIQHPVPSVKSAGDVEAYSDALQPPSGPTSTAAHAAAVRPPEPVPFFRRVLTLIPRAGTPRSVNKARASQRSNQLVVMHRPAPRTFEPNTSSSLLAKWVPTHAGTLGCSLQVVEPGQSAGRRRTDHRRPPLVGRAHGVVTVIQHTVQNQAQVSSRQVPLERR